MSKVERWIELLGKPGPGPVEFVAVFKQGSVELPTLPKDVQVVRRISPDMCLMRTEAVGDERLHLLKELEKAGVLHLHPNRTLQPLTSEPSDHSPTKDEEEA